MKPTEAEAREGTGQAEDRVEGTIFDFGDFRIRRQRLGKQTILEIAGQAGAGFAREFERVAAGIRGDLGLDLSGLQGIVPAHIPILERVRRRLAHLHRGLFLCNPPSRLRDLLALNGIAHLYPVAGRSVAPMAPPERSEGDPGGPPDATESAGRKMAAFDRSIKRTDRLEHNLDAASRCVRKMLPAVGPRVPGYEFAFAYRQCEIVGGDFFDFIPLAGDLLGLSIGDVSGNGLEAAILMCLARKVIALRAREGPGGPAGSGPAAPGEVLARANEDLRPELGRSTFVTALYGILDPRAGTFRFARAGHEMPVRFALGSGEEPEPIASRGAALGLLPDARFRVLIEERAVELRPGDCVLLFTDGIVDARNPRGQSFSRPRLEETLRCAPPGQSPSQVISALLEAVSRHTGGGSPPDDMTALLIARNPTGGAQG